MWEGIANIMCTPQSMNGKLQGGKTKTTELLGKHIVILVFWSSLDP